MEDTAPKDLTPELLIEALEKSRGFILAAKKYIKERYDLEINRSALRTSIKNWGMEEWLQELRTSLAEDCMKRAFHKGISDGDNHCLFWAIEKYGHHVDFLNSRDNETEGKKGWKEILEHVKSTAQPQAN